MADENGKTLANLTVESGSVECVESLIMQRRFYCWNVPDKNDDTPLTIAVSSGNFEIFKILARDSRVDLNRRYKWGRTEAMVAVVEGYLEMLEILAMEERCNIWNVPDDFGDTPILKALEMGEAEIVEFLARLPDMVRILVKCPRVDLDVADSLGRR